VAGHPAQWLAALGVGPGQLTKRDWAWDNERDRVTVRVGEVVGLFKRGMLCELSLTIEQWCAIAERAVATWPIERISITNVPGLAFGVTKVSASWSLSARLQLPGRRVALSGSVSLGELVPSSMSSAPALIDGAADWRVEEPFATRDALVRSVAPMSAELVASLREVAGNRWPSPPRKRR